MTTLAIMQPYFFPYLGYWQLLQAADRFVVYDDVNYIKGGWVNRNRLLIGGQPCYITVPLQQASPFSRICDLRTSARPPWREKLVRMVDLAYRRAPHFERVFPVIAAAIRDETANLSEYLTGSLRAVATLLGLPAEIVSTSRGYRNDALSGTARVLDICRQEAATTYLNLPGGRALYDAEAFRRQGVALRFVEVACPPYRQRSPGFVPALSIIDTLMELGPTETRARLHAARHQPA